MTGLTIFDLDDKNRFEEKGVDLDRMSVPTASGLEY